MKRNSTAAFNAALRKHMHAIHYFQKELAEDIPMNSNVLSRKLSGNRNSYLTDEELWCIFKILAEKQAITTLHDVFQLLALLNIEPDSFSIQKWQTLPLSQSVNNTGAESIDNYALPLTPMDSRPSHIFMDDLASSLTPLIGREKDIAEIQQRLSRDEVRLVTLMGPGGSGKTRLGLQVANELTGAFTHGVWFVFLASVRDPEQVVQNIMHILHVEMSPKVPALQHLMAYLQNKSLLLLLDNFEQVSEAAAVIGELLVAAPGLKVLVTSREVLHLYGEYEFEVRPLEVPDLNVTHTVEKIAQYSAVQLFIERAKFVSPQFALTAENAASIAQICARLDGLPLALELAASRIKVLTPDQMLERLSEARLPLLINGAKNLPSRHHTLRSTINWSYDLLSPTEQAWFNHLGIFSGSWSLEAAEAMMQAAMHHHQDDAVVTALPMLDIITSLVDKSLLVRLPVMAGQMHFMLLETLREYALEKLNVQGSPDYLYDWHAYYYLQVAEEGEVGLKGPQQLLWQARLAVVQDNLRAALTWSLQQARTSASMMVKISYSHFDTSTMKSKEAVKNILLPSELISDAGLQALEVLLRLVSALRPYWEWHGQLVQGRVWLDTALSIPLEKGAGKTLLTARAKAVSETARVACLQNQQEKSIELAEQSIALWRQLDNPAGLATALLYRGWAEHALGQYLSAKQGYEEALAMLPSTGYEWLRAQLLFYMGAVAGFNSEYQQMRLYYAQSRELFEQVGDRSAVADLLKDRGGISVMEGKFADAINDLLQSIAMSRELGHKQYIATGMGLLGFAVGMREKPDPETSALQAALLWGAGQARREAAGIDTWIDNFPLAKVLRKSILARVDEVRWRIAWGVGRNLTEEQAVAACMSLREEYSIEQQSN